MENDKQITVMAPATDNQWPSHIYHYGQYRHGQDMSYYLWKYWNILIKRKWWVLGVFICSVVIAILISFLMTPIYRSAILLQITQDNTPALIGQQDNLAMLSSDWDFANRFLETQSSILSSRPIIYRIIDSLNIREHREFKAFKERYRNKYKSPQELEAAFADELLKKLEVKPQRRSNLVEVSFQSTDKNLAQQVPNTIYKEFMRFSMQTRQQSYKLIKEWLEGELIQLGNKVEASEKKLYRHGQEKKFYSLEGNENPIIKKYIELNALLTRAQSDRLKKEALYGQIKNKGANSPIITNNRLIQQLRADIIKQEAEVSAINKIYDENYPQLQAEQAKLNDLRKRLDGEVDRVQLSVEADYQAALSAENLLREAMENQKSQVTEVQSNLVEHHILKRDVQSNEQLYQGLLTKMKEANVASTMISTNVAIISPADLPYRPYRPRKTVNLLVGSLFGLVVGIGLALVVERLNDSINTVEEMEQVLNKPTLGVVPLLSRDKETGPASELCMASYSLPQSLIGESIRRVRTSIMLSSSLGPPTALMVTSTCSNEGKTTVAINIAISLTLNGTKVAVIDCDLRKPSIHRFFYDEPMGPGLSDFLTGNATVDEIIRPTKVPNLVIIPAGTLPPSPVDLFASKTFEDFVGKLRQDFQYLIFDTPPVTIFADAQVLSPLMDGTLLVLKQDFTTREAAILAKQLLEQVNARVIGAVLNMATMDKMGYDYHKHFARYYSSDFNQIKSIWDILKSFRQRIKF